jgi:DNA-cytosine methyltransferase
MNVLSLFDGISCGQVALQRSGFKPKHYFASEIDTHAISVTQKHFPDTLQVGSVTTLHDIDFDPIGGIDLLMGGSPCQGFSFAGKQLNFDDPRSKLFFDFVKLKNRIKPKYFLLENVSMKREYLDIIDEQLGVKGVMINSNEFSAQGRKRYYWTNIPFTTNSLGGQLIKDVITVEDILQDNVDDKYWSKDGNVNIMCDNEVAKGKILKIADDNYCIHGESVLTNNKHTQISDMYVTRVNPCITPNRLNKRQNGRRFNPPYSKFYTLTTQDRHGILINGNVRQLTPLECERLQTLPDNYTESLSDAKRYHAIGNGWTVNVIAHILKGMKL